MAIRRAWFKPLTAFAVVLFYGGLLGLAADETFGDSQDSATRVVAGFERPGESFDGFDGGFDPESFDVENATTEEAEGSGPNAAVPRQKRATGPEAAERNAPTTRSGGAGQILVGIQYNTAGSDGAYSVLGVKGTSTGDGKGAYEALIEDLNSRGGLAGRKVVPVFYANNNSEGTFDAQSQKACSLFTEDYKVEIGIVTGTATRLLPSCLAKRQVPALPVGNMMLDDTHLAEWAPYVYWPGMLSPDRFAPWVDVLAANGFFAKESKLGLVAIDTPLHHRTVDGVLIPALAKIGFPPTDVAYTSESGSISDLGGGAAELSNVVLRFRSQGIDRVMFVASQGVLPFLWMPQAESQNYRPRYGFTSGDFPYIVQANAAPEQLRDAVGMGWSPARDVDFAQDPGGIPAAERCRAIMAKAGNRAADRSAEWQSHIAPCEAMFFLETVFKRAATSAGHAIRAAVDQLGTSYQSPHTFATRFIPGHYDGVAKVRAIRYDVRCACFGYVGPLMEVP